MKEAEKAGATIVKQAQNTFWGGYAGFKDLVTSVGNSMESCMGRREGA
ncbi:hypothetical protein SAMN05421690_108411 [Nitrosomonas sp. Nm51]|nr:hypothetical protein SAMN05421690_108411 [Nitrosomonas sp. Nm51]